MTVLITGASGHIGNNLVRALIAKGQRPRCLIHKHTRSLEGLDVEKINGDVCDINSLYSAFEGVDVVYHLAGLISLSANNWYDLQRTNITGVRNVVEACLKTGVKRLVHFSSIHAFEREPVDRPVCEDNPLVTSMKHAPYDRSKAGGTLEVRKGLEKGLNAVIVHPTAVIGPFDFQPSYLCEAVLMMAKGKLPALVPGGYDWVDVRDVVLGALAVAEKASQGSAFLLSGHWVSMCDMAALIAEMVGGKTGKFVCPLWLANTGAIFFKMMSKINGKKPIYTSMSLRALQENRNVSHAKAEKELGYQPRPFRDTLEDTLRWFHEDGQLPLHKPD